MYRGTICVSVCIAGGRSRGIVDLVLFMFFPPSLVVLHTLFYGETLHFQIKGWVIWGSFLKGNVFIIGPPSQLRVQCHLLSISNEGFHNPYGLCDSIKHHWPLVSKVTSPWHSNTRSSDFCLLYSRSTLGHVPFSNHRSNPKKFSSLFTWVGTLHVYNDHMEGFLLGPMSVFQSGFGVMSGSGLSLKVTRYWSLWVKSCIFSFVCVLL